MRIGIIGYGFVGQAVHSCIRDAEVVIVDPLKGYVDFSCRVRTADVIFLCLPTPMKDDGTQDNAILQYWLADLHDFPGIIILKSTVVPSIVNELMVEMKVVVNPEFLNANSAVKDFYKQKYVILGGHMSDCLAVKKMYEEFFHFEFVPEFEFMSRKEAVEVKYMHNIYHAFKSLFWNYVYDVTGNHRKIADIYKKLREGIKDNEFSQVASDGKRGYGGACFTKDVAAWENEFPHLLTQFMIEYNKTIREE